MYMPGRLRTASRPSRTVMELPEEAFSAGAAVFGRATTWGLPFAQPARGSSIHTGTRRCRTALCLQRRRTTLGRLLAVSSFPGYRVHRQECRRPRPDVVSEPLRAPPPPQVLPQGRTRRPRRVGALTVHVYGPGVPHARTLMPWPPPFPPIVHPTPPSAPSPVW